MGKKSEKESELLKSHDSDVINMDMESHDSDVINMDMESHDSDVINMDMESHDSDVINMDTKVSWFVCACSSLSNLIIIGCLYTYAIIFPKILEEFQEGKAKTAMVAAIGMGLYLFLSPVAVNLCIRFGCRVVIVASGLTCALGLLGSSFAPKLYVLYLSFGVMVGTGSSLVYMAAVQIVPLYFDKHRDFATAMAAAGPGAGVLVISPVIQALLRHFDWRKTLLVLAAINLLPCILGCSVTRKKIPPTVNGEGDKPVRAKRPSNNRCYRLLHFLDFSVFKNPIFVILTLSVLLALLGVLIPYIHLVKHAIEVGVPSHQSSWVIFATGPTSLVCRIFSGILCNTAWISYLRFYQFALIMFAVSHFLAPMATTFTSLMVYSVAYGICDGMYATSINCFIMNSFGASGFGWFSFFEGFSFFASPVLAGLISDVTGSYHPAFYTAGGFLLMSCCVSQLTRCIKTKNRREIKLKSVEEEELVIFQRETAL